MKKELRWIAVIWGAIMILSFVVAPYMDFIMRFSFSLILAVVVWIGSMIIMAIKPADSSYEKVRQESTSQRQVGYQPRPAQPKCIYIFPGTERRFLYRFDGKYVYQGMSDKFLYRVEGSKIYKGMDSKVAYRMEGNKIYRGAERQPLYRIDGNCIYRGDFGRQPVFRISSSFSI